MPSKLEQLKELSNLLDGGKISNDEYELLKQEILSGGNPTQEMTSTPSQSRIKRLGSYVIKGLIGEGGQGSVYVGRHRIESKAEVQGGDVAIKILHTDNQDMTDRLELEASKGIELEHPNIVKVYDFVMDGDTVGIVMEKVVGIDLSKVLFNRGQPIPWSEVQQWALQIGDALIEAHRKGIVHRDIKPENIMLKGDGTIKILDFGIAKTIDGDGAKSGGTKTGIGLGTVAYMAPEQYMNAKDVDVRADIYALGMTLYELLSGVLPWDGSKYTDFEILEKKKLGDISSFSEVYSGNEVLCEVIDTCLCPKKEDRYTSVVEVVEILKRLDSLSEERRKKTQVIDRSEIQSVVHRKDEREENRDIEEQSIPSDENVEGIESKQRSKTEVFEREESEPNNKVIDEKATEQKKWSLNSLFWIGALLFVSVGGYLYNVKKKEELQTACKEQIDKQIEDAKEIGYGEVLEGKKCESISGLDELKSFVESRKTMKADMVLIPSGSFTMGCTAEQGSDCYNDEKESHKVTISRSFYIGKYEVTQALYNELMGENPSDFKGANRPVEKVSWYDVIDFMNKLSDRDGFERCYSGSGKNIIFKGLDCEGYRLPTESEWEYAARGGENYKYSGSNNVGDVAWYRENSGKETHPVGQKKENGFGLYDMSGNVYEWVWDWFGDYPRALQTDPLGNPSASARVLRGGYWYADEDDVRVSNRSSYDPTFRFYYGGFRLGRSP